MDAEQLACAAHRATLLHRKFGLSGASITVDDMARDWKKTVNATAAVHVLIAETRTASAYRRSLRPGSGNGVRSTRRAILRDVAQRLRHEVVGVAPEVRATLALGYDLF